MKNRLVFIVFILNISTLYTQKSVNDSEINHIRKYCCSVRDFQDDAPMTQKFLIDNVISENKTLVSYVSDRRFLKKLKTYICFENEVSIADSSELRFDLSVTASVININQINEVELDSIDNVKFVNKIRKKEVYGFGNYEEFVKVFKRFDVKINGREIVMPDSAINDLFFPNFCNTEVSIKPIEAFKSKNKKNVYVYVFGLHKVGKNYSDHTISYMCKFIFDKNGYIGRIVSSFKNYRWQFCKDFIGF